MFMGEFHPVLDEKGRVAIPMKLRKAFGDDSLINTLIVTLGFDRCLMAYRKEDWDEFVQEKLVKLPQSNPKNRQIVRRLLGGANECELDRQGRALIPGYLLEKAGIEKDVTILGLNRRIEIWSTDVYGEHIKGEDTVDIFAEDLGF